MYDNTKKANTNKRRRKTMLIKIEKLKEEILKKHTNKLQIELKGMIKTQLSIENPEIQIAKSAFIIFNKKDSKQKIELNLHQIMKIEKMNENVFNIEFDYLQNVTITVINLVQNVDNEKNSRFIQNFTIIYFKLLAIFSHKLIYKVRFF